MGTKYAISISLGNFNIGLLKNTEIGKPSFDFEEFPPSMKGIGESIRKYFTIEYITTKTNNDGQFVILFSVNYGKLD